MTESSLFPDYLVCNIYAFYAMKKSSKCSTGSREGTFLLPSRQKELCFEHKVMKRFDRFQKLGVVQHDCKVGYK